MSSTIALRGLSENPLGVWCTSSIQLFLTVSSASFAEVTTDYRLTAAIGQIATVLAIEPQDRAMFRSNNYWPRRSHRLSRDSQRRPRVRKPRQTDPTSRLRLREAG